MCVWENGQMWREGCLIRWLRFEPALVGNAWFEERQSGFLPPCELRCISEQTTEARYVCVHVCMYVFTSLVKTTEEEETQHGAGASLVEFYFGRLKVYGWVCRRKRKREGRGVLFGGSGLVAHREQMVA